MNELAEKVQDVGRKLGYQVKIDHLENPRKEAEEHYYNPTYQGLIGLGVKPHYLTDEVLEGMMKRNNPIRVLRDNVVIYEGELESLRRFKDDVNEVKSGLECGIGVKNYNDVKSGDHIEVYERIQFMKYFSEIG